MKKRFKALFIFAVLLFVPFALAGCGEDIQVPGNPDDEGGNPVEEQATVFSSSKGMLTDEDGTRTSMKTNRQFLWEAGDYIWLDEAKDGTFSTKLTECVLSSDKLSAVFYLRGKALTETKYDILYTGTVTGVPNKVAIAKEQTQSGWNNSEHFGTSGDCGVAEATNNGTGKYSFHVYHKAAYLKLAPYLNTAITENFQLTKIEIIADGTTIAGTYPFNKTDGIVTTSTIENPSDTIRLFCSGDFPLTHTSFNECFVVLQPGIHTLTIKYTITSTTSNDSFTFAKEAFTKDFKVNGVTTIRHELKHDPYTFFYPNYYLWDAEKWIGYGEGAKNNFYYPMAFSLPDPSDPRYWNESNPNTLFNPAKTIAEKSAKYLPCYNAIAWYMKAGGYWDTSQQFYIDGTLCTGGLWLKKWKYIDGKPDGSTIFDCESAATGLTQSWVSSTSNYVLSTIDMISGRPADNEIDQYFFIPALGYYRKSVDIESFYSLGSYVMFNPGSRRSGRIDIFYAYNGSMSLGYEGNGMAHACVANTRPDGSMWFQ